MRGSGFVFFACSHLFVWVVRKYIFCEIYDTDVGERGERRESGCRKREAAKNMRYVDAPGRKRKAATIFSMLLRFVFCFALFWSGLVWYGMVWTSLGFF